MGVCLRAARRPGAKPAEARAHLTSAVRFAFRVHQFAGGFNDECRAVFNEVRSLLDDNTKQQEQQQEQQQQQQQAASGGGDLLQTHSLREK